MRTLAIIAFLIVAQACCAGQQKALPEKAANTVAAFVLLVGEFYVAHHTWPTSENQLREFTAQLARRLDSDSPEIIPMVWSLMRHVEFTSRGKDVLVSMRLHEDGRDYSYATVLLPGYTAEEIATGWEGPNTGRVSPAEAGKVFEQFARIRLPADARSLSHALKDASWVGRAAFYHQTGLGGRIPIWADLDPPGGVYVIGLSPSVSMQNSGYHIYIHVTRAFPEDTPARLRAFLMGHAAVYIKMDEYALCYPDGRVLHVDPKSRRTFQSP
jgi:hypothetical protein